MDSRVIREDDIPWIASVMYEDGELVESRDRICLALGLMHSELTDIKRRIRQDESLTSFDFFTAVLSSWILNVPKPALNLLVHALQQENFNNTADKISKISDSPPIVPNLRRNANDSIWFDVPEKVAIFTGRVQETKALHTSIAEQNWTDDTSNQFPLITVLNGMGGVGKTSLVVHYAWEFVTRFYKHVVWINSETQDTLTNSFQRLARKLRKNTTVEIKEIAREIYEDFGNVRSLIVFDNVESYPSIEGYLPIRTPNRRKPYVLLTSRNREWNLRTRVVDLSVFRIEESVQYFQEFLGLSSREELELARQIGDDLQNFPLAIIQAGAYIKNEVSGAVTSNEMHGYISLLSLVRSKSCRHLLKFEHWRQTADKYEKTIYSVWSVTMSKVKRLDPLAAKIIELVAYFHSENIPVELFYEMNGRRGWKFHCLPSKVKPTEINKAVKLLVDFSIISKTRTSNSFNVHRLVQNLVREKVEKKSGLRVLNRAIKLIKVPLKVLDDEDQSLLIHAMSIATHIPPNSLDKKVYKKFTGLIKSRQTNSIESQLKQLTELLGREESVAKILESYETSRKIYLSLGVTLREIFTLRFAYIIHEEIILHCRRKEMVDKIIYLSEIFLKILEDFKLSIHSSNVDQDLLRLKMSSDVLYELTCESYSDNYNLLQIRYSVLKVNYDFFKEKDDDRSIFGIIPTLLECLVRMKTFSEAILILTEMNSLLVYMFQYLPDSEGVVQLRGIFADLLRQSKSCALQELVRILLELERSVYNSLKRAEDFRNALKCGPTILEYLIELRSAELSGTIIDFNTVLLKVTEFDLTCDDVDVMVIPDVLYKTASVANDELKNAMLDGALLLYTTIHKYSCQLISTHLLLSPPYVRFLNESIRGVIKCFVALGRLLLIVKFVREIKSWFSTIVENLEEFELLDFSKVLESILECARLGNCTPIQSDILEELILLFDILYKESIARSARNPEDDRLNTRQFAYIASSLIKCYAEVDRGNEILELVKDYVFQMDKQILNRNFIANADVSDTLVRIGQKLDSLEDYEFQTELMLQAYSIYNRVYMFDTHNEIDRNIIQDFVDSYDVLEIGAIFYCLAAHQDRMNDLLRLSMECERCVLAKFNSNSYKGNGEEIAAAILNVAIDSPSCASIVNQLIQAAVMISTHSFHSSKATIQIINSLKQLNRSDALFEIIETLKVTRISERAEGLDMIDLANCLYHLGEDEPSVVNFRDEIYGKAYELYACAFSIANSVNLDTDYSQISRAAQGIIKTLRRLKRTTEIVKGIAPVGRIFRKYCSSFTTFPNRYFSFVEVIDLLFMAGTISGDTELIMAAEDLCQQKYAFEKKMGAFTSLMNTVLRLIECLIRLCRVETILDLSRDCQEIIVQHFGTNSSESVKQMAVLCRILLTKARQPDNESKEMVKESLSISKKWHLVSVDIFGEENRFTLIHYHNTLVCEYLLEGNEEQLSAKSTEMFKIVQKYEDDDDYLLIGITVALELIHAGQKDKVIQYGRFLSELSAGKYKNGKTDFICELTLTDLIVMLVINIRQREMVSSLDCFLPFISKELKLDLTPIHGNSSNYSNNIF